MSRLPRDLTGDELVRALSKLGYAITRQSGSHIRATKTTPTQHHVTVPRHDPLRVGTLAAILGDVAEHLDFTRDELMDQLFG